MSQITSYTSNDEVQSIYSYYANSDGTVDYDAISQAIETGDVSQFDMEDLITAYVTGTGSLPTFMMAPEAYISDPDSYSWLWEDEVVSSLAQLGDLYSGTSIQAQIISFLNWSDANGITNSKGVLAEVEDFLNRYNKENGSPASNDVFNLFNVSDLSEVMSLFVGMGNPGMALLLYTAYALNPAMQEVQDAAIDVISDGTDQMADLLEELESIDTDDSSAQYESQAISQQLSVVSQVMQTMNTFIQNAQDIADKMLEMASNLSEKQSQTQGTMIRNMA